MKMAILYLTCADDNEANKISKVLLKKKLIVCAKKVSVSSSFFWEARVNQAQEVVLLLETEERLFAEIEQEIKKLHSHKVFVLFSIPITKAAKGIKEWMREGLRKN